MTAENIDFACCIYCGDELETAADLRIGACGSCIGIRREALQIFQIKRSLLDESRAPLYKRLKSSSVAAYRSRIACG
jgi:hypothetical protein